MFLISCEIILAFCFPALNKYGNWHDCGDLRFVLEKLPCYHDQQLFFPGFENVCRVMKENMEWQVMLGVELSALHRVNPAII